jgi:hypothetical protein
MEGIVMTVTEKLVRGLLKDGFVEQKSSSFKYRRFVKQGRQDHLVGKRGALRIAVKEGIVSNSWSVAPYSDIYKKIVALGSA